MKEFIIYPLKEGSEAKEDEDKTNLFREDTVTVFSNAKSVIIQTTFIDGTWPYSLSLVALLSFIQRTSWKEVTVKAVTEKKKKSNWISNVWSTRSTAIKQQYKSKNYTISLQHKENVFGEEEDLLIIEKL